MKAVNKGRFLSNADRRERLTYYSRETLYRYLLDHSEEQARVKDCKESLTNLVEHLFVKYVIPKFLRDCYPGCERLSRTMKVVYLDPEIDFGIQLPKFNRKTDLVHSLPEYYCIEFSKEYPIILKESSWSRKDENSIRFFKEIKSLASNEELLLLECTVGDFINSLIQRAEYLKELRTVGRGSYGDIYNLGIFFNLGQLYDYNQDWGLRMKYDILKLSDEVEEDVPLSSVQSIRKRLVSNSLDINTHIEVIKQLLGMD